MLLREITSLSVGDIIPIEINDPVTVYVALLAGETTKLALVVEPGVHV